MRRSRVHDGASLTVTDFEGLFRIGIGTLQITQPQPKSGRSSGLLARLRLDSCLVKEWFAHLGPARCGAIRLTWIVLEPFGQLFRIQA